MLSARAPLAFALALALVGLPGCTATRLRHRTMNQGSTLPELQYQQVLDNLAMFAGNPGALPWHVNLREGTTQITDSLSGGALVNVEEASLLPELFGTRTAVAQWGMEPVVDHTELRLLRIAYRRAVGRDEMPDAEFLDELAHELKDQMASNADLQQESSAFFDYHYRAEHTAPALDADVVTTNDDAFYSEPRSLPNERSPLARNTTRQVDAIRRDLARVRPGWFHVGGRRDVPRDACYVGHSGDCYAWVEADGREALTEFTLLALKLSSLIKETQTLISPGSVKFSPGDRGG